MSYCHFSKIERSRFRHGDQMSENIVQEILNLRPEVSYRFSEEERTANKALLKEYLYRVIQWRRKHGIENYGASLDAVKLVRPELKRPEESLEEFNSAKFAKSSFEGFFLRSYIHWNTLLRREPDILQRLELPNPYTPVLDVIAKGGVVTFVHGDTLEVIGGGGIWMNRIFNEATKSFSMGSIGDESSCEKYR